MSAPAFSPRDSARPTRVAPIQATPPAPPARPVASDEDRGSRGWELTLFRHLRYPADRR